MNATIILGQPPGDCGEISIRINVLRSFAPRERGRVAIVLPQSDAVLAENRKQKQIKIFLKEIGYNAGIYEHKF